jgi:hypothetical protein
VYLRLSIQGSLPGGEVWSVNPAFHFNAALSPTWDQASGDAIVAALIAGISSSEIPTALRTLMSSTGFLTGYRLEGRDEDESLLGVSEGLYGAPVPGLGTYSKTNQAAMVISLRTSTPGARGRGRLYWPAVGASASSTTGRLSNPTTSDIANGASALLELISSIIDANAGVFPWTDVILGVRSLSDHQTRTVTRLQVGDIIDTQRRRRDTLPENYLTIAYP